MNIMLSILKHINRQKNNLYLFYIVLTIATILVYIPFVSGDFIFYDDTDYVIENRNIKNGVNFESLKWAITTYHASNWHPVTWISLALDYHIYGLNPSGYKMTNIILHLINVLLLFKIMDNTTKDIWKSFFIAVIFGIHPIHIESIAWITERKDVLSTLFMLLSIHFYVIYTKNEKGNLSKYIASLALYALGLMSKPMIVSMPIVLILFDLWPLDRFKTKQLGRLLAEKVTYASLAFLSCIITIYAQSKGGAIASLELFTYDMRMINALYSYAMYIIKFIIPINLTIYYPHLGQDLSITYAVVISIVLPLLTYITIDIRKNRPEIFVGWLLYIVTLLPVIGLLQVGNQGMADRYMYIPSIGLLIILMWLRKDKLSYKERKITIYALAIISFIYATVTIGQARYWLNTKTLFERNEIVVGDNVVNQYVLYSAEKWMGNDSKSKLHYEKALKHGPTIVARMHNKSGYYLALRKEFSAAESEFKRATEILPDYGRAWLNLGIVVAEQGRYGEARKYMRKSIALLKDDDLNNAINIYMAIENK